MVLEIEKTKVKSSVCYDTENDCIVGNLVGEVTMKTLMTYVTTISEACEENNCKRFLNDISKSELKLSTVELYYLPRMAVKGAFNHSWKRAILLNERNRDVDFYEITAINQSLNIKVFTDRDEAIEWLHRK